MSEESDMGVIWIAGISILAAVFIALTVFSVVTVVFKIYGVN